MTEQTKTRTTWGGRPVVVICDWRRMRYGTPSVMVEYGEPVDTGSGIAYRRAVVPAGEIEREEVRRD